MLEDRSSITGRYLLGLSVNTATSWVEKWNGDCLSHFYTKPADKLRKLACDTDLASYLKASGSEHSLPYYPYGNIAPGASFCGSHHHALTRRY